MHHDLTAIHRSILSINVVLLNMAVLQGKFLSFNYQFAKHFNTDDFNYSELKDTDFVFMRWKVSMFLFFSSGFLIIWGRRNGYPSIYSSTMSSFNLALCAYLLHIHTSRSTCFSLFLSVSFLVQSTSASNIFT